MTLAHATDRYQRGAHFRFHVYVTASKVWNFERQAFDWLAPDEQTWELVRGYHTETEANAERLRFETEAAELARTGNGTAPDLEFTVTDTQK